jgi:hypothetical protein
MAVDYGILSEFKTVNDYDNERRARQLQEQVVAQKLAQSARGGDLPAPIQVANEMFKYKQMASDVTLDPVSRQAANERYNLIGQSAKTYGFTPGLQYDLGTLPQSAPNMPPATASRALGVDGRGLPSLPIPKIPPMTNPQAADAVIGLFGDGNATGENGAPPPAFRPTLTNAPKVSAVPGFSAASAGIAADKKRAETQAQKDVELGMNPTIKTAETEAVNLVKAREDYSKAYDSYVTGKTVLDRALASPGLNSNFGKMGILPNIPGGEASDASAILDQIEGGAFLTAFESLKGGGQITEVEGAKATSAIVRAKRAQSAEAFRTAIGDYMDVMSRGLERARQSASGEVYNKWKDPATSPKAPPQDNTPSAPVVSKAVFDAKKALAAGKSKEAVRQRLIENNINPSLAGI